MRSCSLMIAALVCLAALPAHAADTAPASERLLVGKTNIYCVQAPCPWRGIARQYGLTSGPDGLLWSQHNLPRLDASANAAGRIEMAWEEGQCLVVDGRLIGSTLEIDRIIGTCP